METIPQRVLGNILFQLKANEIIKLCQTYPLKERICQSGHDMIWRKLYARDIDLEVPPNPYEEYFRVFSDLEKISVDNTENIQEKIQYAIQNQYRILLWCLLRDHPQYLTFAIEIASYDGYNDIVNDLIDLSDVSVKIDVIHHAIYHAGLGNHPEIINNLLELEPSGIISALEGSIDGGHLQLFQRLIDMIPSNVINIDDLIQLAAFNNRVEIIDDLLSRGGDLLSALLGSIQGGHKNLIVSLVNYGNSHDLLNREDIRDARKVAMIQNKTEIQKTLKDLEESFK
jgi:hypothetical protein